MKSSVHFWFPDIFRMKGGIQSYSASVLEAFQKIRPADHYEVFLKNDERAEPEPERFQPGTRFHCCGDWPGRCRTPAFAARAALAAAISRPRLIFSSHLHFSPLAARLAALWGQKFWVAAHGIEAWNATPRLRESMRSADRILAVSGFTRQKLIDLGVDPDRIGILPNTFDEKRFTPRPKASALMQRYGLKPDQKVIMTVTRLDGSRGMRYKGYDRIIELMPALRSRIPGLHYLLVGDGDDRMRIREMIDEKRLQDAVTLTGCVDSGELADHYALCDLYAMPSISEGFGIVFLEAMACGKPCIGGCLDGSREPLAGGELGVLVDPTSNDGIAEAIFSVLERRHPNQVLYRPERLAGEVIDRFGSAAFSRVLEREIAQHF